MLKNMMMVLVLAAGCTKASTANETPTNHEPGAAPRAKSTVTLTSVTFGNDCGGTAPHQAPVPSSPAVVAPADEAAKESSQARRRCEQTSMQLAIASQGDMQVQIKRVEVFDEAGKSVGVLAASKPTHWVDAKATYETWDEKVAAGQTERVSYVLAQPAFTAHYDSHDRTYTVKVTASVGGVDQPLQTTVMVAAQPAPVPT
jgi:hypothetical protein